MDMEEPYPSHEELIAKQLMEVAPIPFDPLNQIITCGFDMKPLVNAIIGRLTIIIRSEIQDANDELLEGLNKKLEEHFQFISVGPELSPIKEAMVCLDGKTSELVQMTKANDDKLANFNKVVCANIGKTLSKSMKKIFMEAKSEERKRKFELYSRYSAVDREEESDPSYDEKSNSSNSSVADVFKKPLSLSSPPSSTMGPIIKKPRKNAKGSSSTPIKGKEDQVLLSGSIPAVTVINLSPPPSPPAGLKKQ